MWWSWVSATLYANRFDHDDVVYRLYKLASMLCVIGMAASATEAVGTKSGLFAGCYIALRVLLISQYARAYRHVRAARRGIRLYLAGTGASALLWVVSLALPAPAPAPAPARYWMWAVGAEPPATALHQCVEPVQPLRVPSPKVTSFDALVTPRTARR